MSLSWIPKGILENLRGEGFRFLWLRCKEKERDAIGEVIEAIHVKDVR
jgi:hypothetical protein